MLSFAISSCEKDDICDEDTATTPKLVINFYDFYNATEAKEVTDLTIIASGMTEGVTYDDSTLINGSTVSIPLKTDANTTTYSFILNYDNDDPALTNEDVFQFDYLTTDIFVSRACGYKTTFAFDGAHTVTLTDGSANDALWIKYFVIKTQTIDNEDETHIDIYF